MRLLPALSLLAVLSSSLVSCKADDPSAIVVGVSNELPTPGTLSSSTDSSTILRAVRIIVRAGGEERLNQVYELDPGKSEIKLPGTLTVSKNKDSSSDVVTVEVRGLRGSPNDANQASEDVIVRRTATLSFVDGKQKLLRMPLQMACIGSLSCADGQTCKSGACASDAVGDTDTLPDFSEEKIIPQGGSCFDREACVDDDRGSFTRAELLTTLQKQRPDLVGQFSGPATDSSRLFNFKRLDGNKCKLPNIGLLRDAKGELSLQEHKSTSVNMGFFWKEDPKRWVVVDRDAQEGWDFLDEEKLWLTIDAGACDELEKKDSRIVSIINYESDKPQQCQAKPPTQPECPLPTLAGNDSGGSGGSSGSGGAGGSTIAGSAGASPASGGAPSSGAGGAGGGS
jgi:uncharacterized membrane protein YgcG